MGDWEVGGGESGRGPWGIGAMMKWSHLHRSRHKLSTQQVRATKFRTPSRWKCSSPVAIAIKN